ncbi:MAG TPA: carbamoyltransferase C-terminal domain-containing protein [Polyangia bacterium]|nr:carbamoyltransferase C-terminal domain-containing protein [Polyangia bacterium]
MSPEAAGAKRYYIGLASSCHDPAIAIVDDSGEVVFAEATERFLQHKRAWDCVPDNLLYMPQVIRRYCDPSASFVVATTWSPRLYALLRFFYMMGLLRSTRLTAKNQSRSSPFVLERYKMTWLSSLMFSSLRKTGINLVAQLKNQFGNANVRFQHFPHHLTHAAFACYSSPFENAACAIMDGNGEFGSHSFYAYDKGALRPIKLVKGFGSLGFLYSRITELCGFDWIAGEEWKVMGLASYGQLDARIYELIRSLVVVRKLSMNFVRSPAKMDRVFAEVRRLVRGRGNDPMAAADLAFTGQVIFSEIALALIKDLYAMGVSDDLVVGGGCALNSSFNGQVLTSSPFRRLHVPSAPGDDGNAIGAAWLAYRRDHPGWVRPGNILSAYLGSSVSSTALENLMRFGQLQHVRHLPGTVHREAARLLAQGKLIGWVQGRAEFGPRALGNRSILADARDPGMKDRINAIVKFREEFRPFAPSILHEHGDVYFENYQETPYMEATLRFRPEVRGKVPAVVHHDHTGRLQTVKKEWNERYHALLSAYYELTGVPLVLNTSFNIMGKPIIHSVEDALGLFFTTGLDVLVIDDYLIEKPAKTERPQPVI